jgi:hypothetical protein
VHDLNVWMVGILLRRTIAVRVDDYAVKRMALVRDGAL